MQSLCQILIAIEGATGVPINGFQFGQTFHSQSILAVLKFVSGRGEGRWNAVDLQSGELTNGKSWDFDGVEHLDKVLFALEPEGNSLIIALPEADVGVQFVTSEERLLPLAQKKSDLLAGYLRDLDFADLGGNHGAWSSFVEEWKALPIRFD